MGATAASVGVAVRTLMIFLFCLMVAALVYVVAIGALASFFDFGARWAIALLTDFTINVIVIGKTCHGFERGCEKKISKKKEKKQRCYSLLLHKDTGTCYNQNSKDEMNQFKERIYLMIGTKGKAYEVRGFTLLIEMVDKARYMPRKMRDKVYDLGDLPVTRRRQPEIWDLP
ncbi:hypothetical protein Tco_1343827 [Tanacetum coccineum]